MPLQTQHVVGRFLGVFAWKFFLRERDNAMINLQLCFPEKDNLWHQQMAKNSLKHAGKMLLEIGALWRWEKDELCELVTIVDNEEILIDALNKNRGVILASPHMGAWELISTYVGSTHPMITLFRPSRLNNINPVIKKARERFGQKSVPTTSAGMRVILKALSKKYVIGILPDQEPDRVNGVFAPFYRTPACTMTLICKLASKKRIPIVFCVMERLKQGYKLHYLKADDDCYNKDPVIAATAMNKTLEKCIAISPEQYLWNYRRFRLRQDGSRRCYKIPSPKRHIRE